MHTNLFSSGHSRAEVYQALLAHQKRDHRVVVVADLGLIAGLIMTMNSEGSSRVFWVVLAVICASVALRHFIDMSNRNHFLHRLDWEEATAREMQEHREHWFQARS